MNPPLTHRTGDVNGRFEAICAQALEGILGSNIRDDSKVKLLFTNALELVAD